MDATRLTLVIAIVLVLAVAVGWVCCWLFLRLNRPSGLPHPQEPAEETVRRALDARDAAMLELGEMRRDLARQMAAKDSELEATMSGLGNARREAMEWRRAYEDLSGSTSGG
ncbi:hypothetical protein FDP22_20215 (plasmid) [Paroceanicella profunda]|uniref:Uncharacterized protein n=1 Tax=Paroceanicella profunda TaxID=2579971 RepID=A0A5B8G2P6_9RHOB|nr:hypothetical protein [Paroceanicella profunda]QDL94180.1 hypothetical protein FDP22_20215 [Paroceanicella profunda]